MPDPQTTPWPSRVGWILLGMFIGCAFAEWAQQKPKQLYLLGVQTTDGAECITNDFDKGTSKHWKPRADGKCHDEDEPL